MLGGNAQNVFWFSKRLYSFGINAMIRSQRRPSLKFEDYRTLAYAEQIAGGGSASSLVDVYLASVFLW